MPDCPQCQKPMAHLYYGGSKGEWTCLNALCPSNVKPIRIDTVARENEKISENIRDYWRHLAGGSEPMGGTDD